MADNQKYWNRKIKQVVQERSFQEKSYDDLLRKKGKKITKYVVTATNTKSGKRMTSQEYRTRAQAQKHLENTKKNWKGMVKNPRIKKV